MQPVKANVMHDFKSQFVSPSPVKVLGVLLVFVLLGVVSGFGLSKLTAKNVTTVPTNKNGTVAQSEIKKGMVIGSNSSVFKDTTEGILKEGGLDGEGQFHLERGIGPSQYAYLTSSVLDLSQFVGRKVKVWGQTHKAEKAPWLMDVGKVQVLE